jgi:ubiquitin-protein ligase E3 A
LEQLLRFSGDVQSAFEFNFQISYESLGEIRTIDLKENGSAAAVTNENREEYVSLYVDYILNNSVMPQFQAFYRGFTKVCGGAALDLFTASELELLICGNPVLDFHALQRGTRFAPRTMMARPGPHRSVRYDDGYDGTEDTIGFFWEILHSFDEAEKRKFLKFMSGRCVAADTSFLRLSLSSRQRPLSDRRPRPHELRGVKEWR